MKFGLSVFAEDWLLITSPLVSPNRFTKALILIYSNGISYHPPTPELFPTLPPPPSKQEAAWYYAGIPSKPLLVARTGAPWKEPTGMKAYPQFKALLPVGVHAIEEVWEDGLASKVQDLLDSMKVNCTSIDIVRIKNVEDPSGPVTLWIGVLPASLSGADGVVVVHKCRDLLVEYAITDVNVEIRESVVTWL
jgi:hypothetical protein